MPYTQTGTAITGILTEATAIYTQGDSEGRRKAIAKVEAAESTRRRELETLSGRRLSESELLRGGIDHPEARDARELRRAQIAIIKPSEQPADGLQVALDYAKTKLREEELAKMTLRERMVAQLEDEIAAREPEPEPPSKEAVELMKAAMQFAQSVKFTDGATAEHVERADALMDVARTGDADSYHEALTELSLDIKATIFDGPMAEAQKNFEAMQERAAMFDVEKPKPPVDPSRIRIDLYRAPDEVIG